MDLKEIPLLGGSISALAVFWDLAFYGGELFVSLVLFAIVEPTTWLSVVMYLRTLAGRVAWLPEGPLESLLILALVMVVSISTARFIQQWRESRA